MTQALPKPSKPPLYDLDLSLWLESAIAKLKSCDLQNIGIANVVEELEGLAGRDNPELKKRFGTSILKVRGAKLSRTLQRL